MKIKYSTWSDKLKKVVKYFTIILAVLVLLAILFVKFMLPSILENKLTQKLQRTFDSYYVLSYSEIQTNIDWNGLSIVIIDPVLKSDTTQTFNNNKFPTIFFEASHLEVNNIPSWDILFTDELCVESVILREPELLSLDQMDSTGKKEDIPLVKDNKQVLSKISVDYFEIESGRLNFAQFSNPKNLIFSGKEINVEVMKFVAEPEKLKSQKYMSQSFEDIIVESGACDYKPLGLDYSFQFTALKAGFNDQRLSVDDVGMIPVKGMKELGKEVKFRKTITDLNVKKLDFYNLDYAMVLSDSKLKVKKMVLDSADFHLLRNHKKNVDRSVHRPYIPEYLDLIKMPFEVDSLILQRSIMTMDLITDREDEYTPFVIRGLDAVLTQVKNGINEEDTMKLVADGVLQGDGKLNFEALFPYSNKKVSIYKGEIKSMSFISWNDLLWQFASIKFESGEVDRIKFKGTSNGLTTKGYLSMSYTDMKLSVFKNGSKTSKKRGLLSLLGNLVLKNDVSGENVKWYSFTFTKNHYQGQMMVWLGGILDGIRTTVIGEKPASLMSDLELKQ